MESTPAGLQGGGAMNFYTLPHKHYCGVDLHSRTMYLCIVGRDGVWTAIGDRAFLTDSLLFLREVHHHPRRSRVCVTVRIRVW